MKYRSDGSLRGQVLVIVAGGLVVIVAAVGLVIDGGQAWVRQRDAQNGADAVAKAGTIVVQHYLALEDLKDFDVACAVADAADANGVIVEAAEYVDYKGDVLVPAAPVGACTVNLGVLIPTGAQGVKARTSESFDTLLMSVIGVPQLTTEADAIAVVGELVGVPGGALPVTFPQTADICDRVNPVRFTIRGDDHDGTWEPYEIVDPATTALTPANEAIVPLCDTGPNNDRPGSVGWLDWGCGQHNLSDAISNPCDVFIPIPAWVQTQTGNTNSLEDDLNVYTGGAAGVGTPESDAVLALPIHDFTCDQDILDADPPSSCPSYDTWSGMGNNLYYHIPFWVGFKLDAAYTGGNDDECGETPGSPLLADPDPPGKVGCLKGWFVSRFDAPGPINIGPIGQGSTDPMVVTLIN